VSGYLDRLAARASGAPAAVAPRLPSRFEDSAPSNQVTVEDVEAVTPTRTSGEAAALVSDRRAIVPVGMRPPGTPELRPERAESTGDRPRGDILRATRGDHRGAAAAAAQDPTPNRLELPVTSAPLSPKDSDLPTAAIRAIVPVNPAASGVDESRPATAVSTPPGPVDAVGRRDRSAVSAPDVVHVSIGRVEVRASLTPAPAAPLRPARSESTDGTSSLHDYLQGRRSR
jgi:hypothetical protein